MSAEKPFEIPSCPKDVTSDWVAELLHRHLGVPRSTDEKDAITLLQICAEPSQGFHETCHVTAKCSSQPDVTHRLLVDIVPADPDLREVIVKHNLFAKELLLYSEVLPLLKDYVRRRANVSKTIDVTFSVPKFLFGDYDASTGSGVMVFEDYSETGPYRLDDPHLMLLDPGRVREVVRNLATFHGICVAFRATEPRPLEAMFPVLDGEAGGAPFFHEDMRHFLDEMYSTCRNFLKSIPGQEEVSEWFESRMSSPETLHRESSGDALPSSNKFRSVIHGDLWHNNLFFLQKSSSSSSGQQSVATPLEELSRPAPDPPPPFLMADWQMCHVGSATNDLCFLLFSSTTPGFRREHWDDAMALYFDSFVGALRGLGVTERELSVSFQEFLAAVKASVPISLFFCGNVQDFDVHAEAAEARNIGSCQEDEEDWEETFRKLQSCLDLREAESTSVVEEQPTEEKEDDFPDLNAVYKGEEAAGGIQISFSKNDADGGESVGSEEGKAEQTPPRQSKGSFVEEEGKDKEEEKNIIATASVALEMRGMSKVPTIASETDLRKLEALKRARRRWEPDPRRARALRRKLYLDLYKEAAGKGFI